MEFLENRRSWENQKPPENRQKSGLLWASSFAMHLVCTLLTQRAQILKKFKIALRDWNFQARLKRMTFSSEIENFKRATHQTPIFVGNSQGQDWNFQARLKFSSAIENFKRNLEIFKRSSEIVFFQDSGPLGNFRISRDLLECGTDL